MLINRNFGDIEKQWNKRFFDLAELVATWSEDQHRKVGCVIVGPNNEVRSLGFNGLPRRVKSTPERLSRENKEKYFWICHSEENAVANAARVGIPLEHCVMYTTLFPCADCCRTIIQSGIERVYTYKFNMNDPTYAQSFSRSLQMFDEAYVDVHLFEKEI